MLRFLLVAAAVGATLARSAPGQTPETGRVTGRVTLTTRVPGVPLPSSLYPSRSVDRRATTRVPEIRNVVVYLKDVAFRGRLPATTAELGQEHEAFVPHVMAITKGSSVTFPNNDAFFHNVFSLSGAGTFDLGRYPKGQTRARRFDKPGLVKVFCHIHSQMSATILVLDHPYFTTPVTDGTFELSDVPAGQYTVVGWHERVGERTARITVEAGKAASVDLSLPVEDPR